MLATAPRYPALLMMRSMSAFKEAATILGVHPNTVRNRITSGKLPAIKAMTPTSEAYIIARKDLHPLHHPTKGVGSGIAPYNNLVPPIDEGNDAFVGVPSTLPVSLTRALQQVVAPLIEENTRLQGIARQQAEELAWIIHENIHRIGLAADRSSVDSY